MLSSKMCSFWKLYLNVELCWLFVEQFQKFQTWVFNLNVDWTTKSQGLKHHKIYMQSKLILVYVKWFLDNKIGRLKLAIKL
jgi:hypothetical protein